MKKTSPEGAEPTLTGAPQAGLPLGDAALHAALESALRHRDFTAAEVVEAVGAYARRARVGGATVDHVLEALQAELERIVRPRTRPADYEVIAPYLARRAVRAYHQPR